MLLFWQISVIWNQHCRMNKWMPDVRVPYFAPQKALISGPRFCIDVANDAKRILVDMRFHGQNMVFNEAFKKDKKWTRATIIQERLVLKNVAFFPGHFSGPAAKLHEMSSLLSLRHSLVSVYTIHLKIPNLAWDMPCTL